MIESSAAYKSAVVADARRTRIRTVIDIISPDLVYGAVTGQSKAPWSNDAQTHDKKTATGPNYATLETGYWLLDGTFDVFPDDYAVEGPTGYASGDVSGADGGFETAQYAELDFSGVTILQACSVYFSDRIGDGVPVNFTVEVRSGGVARYTQSFTDNTETHVSIEGFTVYMPDALRVTVTKWSLPSRRVRIAELILGVYEIWDNDMLAAFNVTQQGDFSCTALPYGTCTLRMDNLSRRFEPRAKAGLFQSIEERQGIEAFIGVDTDEGTDYKPVGVFYQYSGGWKTGDNGLSMEWRLVDIVGLLAEREFIPPAALPTTLEGWVAALVAQLGVNFAERYTVDPDYRDKPVIANSRADVTGKKCGDLLRFACMRAGVWPRADAETGYLAAEPLWKQGNRLTIDNLSGYPVMKANEDAAAVIFTLADGENTQYIFSGSNSASSKTVSVQNPFIHTQAEALEAARNILALFGGNRLETVGRGDMSAEIGDVETVELDEVSAMSARRMFQSFNFQDGVLQGCQSTLLQADGNFQFENRVFLTGSGEWTSPAGVTELRVVLGGGGTGGTGGTGGSWSSEGKEGESGSGGKIWYGTLTISEGLTFAYSCGKGGAGGAGGAAGEKDGDEGLPGSAGSEGTDTTFGLPSATYSSLNGRVYSPSYTDIGNGDVYGKSGGSRANSADGGNGGGGGMKRNTHKETVIGESYNGNTGELIQTWTDLVEVVDNEAAPGAAGQRGADGFVLIWYDLPKEA